jgi:hypothetical protein
MNVRSNIKSGQSIAASTNATINQTLAVTLPSSGGVNAVVANNIGVIAQTSVATGVSIGGVSVSVDIG